MASVSDPAPIAASLGNSASQFNGVASTGIPGRPQTGETAPPVPAAAQNRNRVPGVQQYDYARLARAMQATVEDVDEDDAAVHQNGTINGAAASSGSPTAQTPRRVVIDTNVGSQRPRDGAIGHQSHSSMEPLLEDDGFQDESLSPDSDTAASRAPGLSSYRLPMREHFRPRPQNAFPTSTANGDPPPPLTQSEPYLRQRVDTVMQWPPLWTPNTDELSMEQVRIDDVERTIRKIKDRVPRPELRSARRPGDPRPTKEESRDFIREYIRYYIRLRRIERSWLRLVYGGSELCNVCSKLEITSDKFIVKDREHTIGYRADGKFNSGTASSRKKLGRMRLIVSKATFCPMCRLLVNALAEQKRYREWLNFTTLTMSRGLTAMQSEELNSIECDVQWEIDGRAHPYGGGRAKVTWPSVSSDVPPACTRRLRVEWKASDQLQSVEGWEEITPAYLVLLAGPAGIEGSGKAFLGRQVATRLASTSLIHTWLHHCEKHHKGFCNPTPNQSKALHDLFGQPYFSVIDVQAKRLVALPDGAQYVALSYTWGGFRFYTTQKDSVRSSQENEYFDKLEHRLPQTIKDSITLVQSLGLRYLWVDALCIIQDSTRSWQSNVAIMDQIYGNAWFTICAADGADPDSGLKGLNKADRQLSQNIEKVAKDVHLMVNYPAETYIQRSQWNKRAWTFQERLLSRRCVIFVSGRVFFQCRYSVQREDIFSTESKGWSIEHYGTPLKTLSDTLKRPLYAYMECVRLYTQRHLTRSNDMLDAFTGVGNFISRVLGKDGLLYGLPRSHFDWALLWQMTPSPEARYRGNQRVRPELSEMRKNINEMFSLMDPQLREQLRDAHQVIQLRLEEAQRDHEVGRNRASRADSGLGNGPGTRQLLYQLADVEDYPNMFPTWSWCGWTGSYSQYYSHMLYGITSNVQHWLKYRTWITWYVRDREGRLKLVWEPEENANQYDEELDRRWKGYQRNAKRLGKSEDVYGRPIKLDAWDEMPRGKPHFQKTLEEFPFRNTYQGGEESSHNIHDDLRYLQFFTWSAHFRLRPFENSKHEVQRRCAIIDYKNDVCGVIDPDRIGEWEQAGLSLHLGSEGFHEFIAISEAKEFSSEECEGWKEYSQHEAEDWGLFYVLLVAEHKGVHHRFGLGKVTKEAFQNCCKEPCEWKEIILG